MTVEERPVRRRRTRGLTVAVTGAAGALGFAAVARLVGVPGVKKVVAIDVERGPAPEGVTWRVADVRDPALPARLGGVDVVVHLAVDWALDSPREERHALNVRGTTVVLTAAAAAGVTRVVVVTSAMVYGARADNPVPLPDDAPLAAVPDGSVVADWLEIEELVEQVRRAHPSLDVVVLRPAAVVGPGIDSAVTRHFEAPRLLVLKGSVPHWQFCHVDDLVAAVELAALGRVSGAVPVASPGWLSQAEVERISGTRRLELPSAMAIGTIERLHTLGVTPANASELGYLAHPWVVDPARLTEAGWAPAYDNEAALRVLLAEAERHTAVGGRRLDRADAARAAAGATVALVGTAALVRRARKRRRG